MLILDKTRTLDLMIARAEQVVVPEPYTASVEMRRIAVYEPASTTAVPAVAAREPVASPLAA
jgi:hypothetical protein